MQPTINGKNLSEVTKEEALKFIHENKREYIYQSGEGERGFDCLVAIVEEGTISINELPSYGVSDQDFNLV